MLKFENEGLAYFSVDCILWTNSMLSALASKAFPRDPGGGGVHLDQTLTTIAHKIGMARKSKNLAIRIERGFELAVFKVLLDNGMPIKDRNIIFDPGGAILGPAIHTA